MKTLLLGLIFLSATIALGQSTRYPTASGGSGTVTSITATSPLTGGTITSSGSIGVGPPLQGSGAYTVTSALNAPMVLTPVVTAHANSDTPAGLYVNPTFASGGHSGLVASAATLQANTTAVATLALTLSTDGNYGNVMEVLDQGNRDVPIAKQRSNLVGRDWIGLSLDARHCFAQRRT